MSKVRWLWHVPSRFIRLCCQFSFLRIKLDKSQLVSLGPHSLCEICWLASLQLAFIESA